MAIIAPNTTVMICAGVPLSPDYIHTCDFGTATLQSAYFTTKTKFVLTNYTYQRKTNSIKVNLTTEQLYNCNYMAYQNSSFENKWFYAFITNIEYLNNTTTEITFQEDVFQTWMFDYTISPCFVDREHTLDDTIGKNTQPESLETGPYIVEQYERYPQSDSLYSEIAYVIYAGVKVDLISSDTRLQFAVSPFEGGDTYNANNCIYTGLCPNLSFKGTLTSGVSYTHEQCCAYMIDAIIDANYSDSIVAIEAVPNWSYSSAKNLTTSKRIFVQNITYNKPYTNIKGYVPKNKKLFTAPFKFLNVSNGEGNEANYNYELFSSNNVNFTASNDANINFKILLRAAFYQYLATQDTPLTLTNYPNCSYTMDTYKTWYAQNQIAYKNNITSAAIDGALTAASMAPGLAGAMGKMAKAVKDGNDAQAQATKINSISNVVGAAASAEKNLAGTILDNLSASQIHQINNINSVYTGNDSISLVTKQKCFHFKFMCLTEEYLKIIDNYFSAFGYKTNAFKKPNTTGRASWNYVKTIGSDVTGSIPQYAISILNGIYDAGVTIWHNPAWIGNYNRDNSIVGNG